MPSEDNAVRVLNGALDEDKGEIILRGVIDPRDMKSLRVDKYQREVLSRTKIEKLKQGHRDGGVPDVELGLRGETYNEGRNGVFLLVHPLYMIDGLQRVTAAIELLEEDPDIEIRLGAKIHFGTNEKSERTLFNTLNSSQTGVSSNVLIRNKADENPAVDALLRLSGNNSFVMKDMICWEQSMKRGHLISAVTYVKVICMLQSHAGPGRNAAALEVIEGAVKIMENIGRSTFISNTRVFFDVIDQAWGVKRVAFRNSAPYIKSNFLLQLARIFSDHLNFWDGDRLVVDKATIRKLEQFPIGDPEIIRLSSAGGSAGVLLNQIMVKHIDSGRRKNRLQLRRPLHDTTCESDLDGGEK